MYLAYSVNFYTKQLISVSILKPRRARRAEVLDGATENGQKIANVVKPFEGEEL